MLVNFQDWLSSIQQAAYLPATSMTMTFSESLDLSSLKRLMTMIHLE